MKHKRAAKIIWECFNLAEDEFGEDKSTEFLVAITAERLNISQEHVYDALIAMAEEVK